MSAQETVEQVYDLITSQKNGITIEDIAKRHPHDLTVPYSVAQLVIDCRIKSVLRGNKLCYVTVERNNREAWLSCQ